MATVTDMESYQQYAEQQQQANNEFNAAQAAKQMDFQKMMSDTAHQREVADLKAAGLNPVLSAGGQGASSAQGAAAEADTSAAANVGAILQQVLQAQSAREVANMYNAATIAAAQISASASMYGADMNYQNTEDHPKTWREVVARAVNGLFAGITGSNSTAGGAKQLATPVPTSQSYLKSVTSVPKAQSLIKAAQAKSNSAYQKLYNGLSTWQKIRFKAYCATHRIKNPSAAQLQSWIRSRK